MKIRLDESSQDLILEQPKGILSGQSFVIRVPVQKDSVDGKYLTHRKTGEYESFEVPDTNLSFQTTSDPKLFRVIVEEGEKPTVFDFTLPKAERTNILTTLRALSREASQPGDPTIEEAVDEDPTQGGRRVQTFRTSSKRVSKNGRRLTRKPRHGR